MKLTSSHALIRYFDLGLHNEGLWNYDHMALQNEDAFDILSQVFPDYDFCFIMEQSTICFLLRMPHSRQHIKCTTDPSGLKTPPFWGGGKCGWKCLCRTHSTFYTQKSDIGLNINTTLKAPKRFRLHAELVEFWICSQTRYHATRAKTSTNSDYGNAICQTYEYRMSGTSRFLEKWIQKTKIALKHP